MTTLLTSFSSNLVDLSSYTKPALYTVATAATALLSAKVVAELVASKGLIKENLRHSIPSFITKQHILSLLPYSPKHVPVVPVALVAPAQEPQGAELPEQELPEQELPEQELQGQEPSVKPITTPEKEAVVESKDFEKAPPAQVVSESQSPANKPQVDEQKREDKNDSQKPAPSASSKDKKSSSPATDNNHAARTLRPRVKYVVYKR